jgi:ABC-type phosphate transport system permease subunit
MKNILLSISTVSALIVGSYLPALADDGPVGALGAAVATVVDAPEGVVVDSLYFVPLKASKGLAEAFGDENGWKQQIVGTLIGVPVGVVFGVPYGFCHGLHHAWNKGYEKPFSVSSFVVTDSDN